MYAFLESITTNKMKDEIIEILKSETFNISDEAGNSYIIISDEDFESIAERIEKLFDTIDIKQQLNNKHNDTEKKYKFKFEYTKKGESNICFLWCESEEQAVIDFEAIYRTKNYRIVPIENNETHE